VPVTCCFKTLAGREGGTRELPAALARRVSPERGRSAGVTDPQGTMLLPGTAPERLRGPAGLAGSFPHHTQFPPAAEFGCETSRPMVGIAYARWEKPGPINERPGASRN